LLEEANYKKENIFLIHKSIHLAQKQR